MAVRLRWQDEAKDDLRSILEFISLENPRAATTYVQAIERACEKLILFPLSGRAYSQRYRALVVRNHLVLYRYDSAVGEITVVAVIDGRRDVATIIGDL
jgi:plasmid stabilization system protein ParE